MKWIKASERLPEETGNKSCKYTGAPFALYYHDRKWYYNGGDGDEFKHSLEHLEWLDESESPALDYHAMWKSMEKDNRLLVENLQAQISLNKKPMAQSPAPEAVGKGEGWNELESLCQTLEVKCRDYEGALRIIIHYHEGFNTPRQYEMATTAREVLAKHFI